MRLHLRVVLPLLVFAAAFVVYGPALHHPFIFDDFNLFERGSLNEVFLRGFAFEVRWLPYFTMAWIDLIFEDRIFAQRCTSLAIHLLTAYVLYALIKQISNHVAPHRHNERAALAAALLFALHPLAVYAVGYLAQRTILLATLFGLLSLSTHFDGLVTRKKTYFFFSAFFYLLSVFSKEHAILIPVVALALTPLAGPVTKQMWRGLLLPFSLYAAIAGFVVAGFLGIVGGVYEPLAAPLVEQYLPGRSPATIWGLSVLTQAALFFKYMGLMLIPYPGWMSIDMRVPVATSFGRPEYLLGLLALVVYAAVSAIWLLRGGRRGLLGFALLAPLLLFVVEFSAVRIQEPFVLYRSYLWLAPVFFLLPSVTYAWKGMVFWLLVLSVAIAFAYASSDRLKSFSSEYALWDDAVRKLPEARALGSARAYANRGYENVKRGDFDAAIADLTQSLSVNPRHKRVYQMRAFAQAKLGNYQAALDDANAFIHLDPADPVGYTVRGVVYQGKGDLDLAVSDFDRACRQEWPAACIALGMAKQQAITWENKRQ